MTMERSREARRPTMAATSGFLRLRERPNKRNMSKKHRWHRGDHDHETTEESLDCSDEHAPPLTVVHEMIGVAVPRKARSASGKRSHEKASSGNYGGAREEESLQQQSVKAASLSFSNVSSRKKMKPNGTKNRASKSSKSSVPVEEDIEIEIAEVLYGLMNQSQSSKDRDHQSPKNSASSPDSKDLDGSEEKKVETESDLMALRDSSMAESVDAESDQPEKIEACSQNSNGEGASGSMELQKDDGKPFMEEEKSILSKVELSREDSTGTKKIPTELELKSKRERFQFDLMAPPPMEKDDLPDFVPEPKPLTQDVEMKIEVSVANEEKMETSSQKLNENPNQDSGSKLHYQGQGKQPKAIVPKPDKNAHSSSVPRSKRCATHCSIAHNIYLHQQVTKMNNFLPAATGSNHLCGTKPDILKVMMPAENIVIGNPVLGSFPGSNIQHSQEKEQAVSNFPGHSGEGRSSEAANSKEITQPKHLIVQQAPQPASGGTQMNGPTSVFPLGQYQGSVTLTSNQSGPLKYAKSTNYPSQSSHSAGRPQRSSPALPTVAAVNFNNPNMTAKEGPYLAINGYPFPISTHLGTPAFQVGNRPQAVPSFNGPFYSNQMFHPSQVQQQQPHLQFQHHVQPTHQNTSTSSDSSPSHKKQESQKLREAQFSSTNFLTSTSMQLQQSQKQYVPPTLQSCKVEGEMNGENTASPAASHAQNTVYGQNFSVPFQPVNFTLMPYVTMGGGASGNHIEHSQQQGLKGGVELIPSKAFGMSFSFSGNNGTGSCLNFSSMAQNQPIIQNLPDMARQGYKVAPAPQAAQQKNHHHQISERKTGVGSNNPDGLKGASGKSFSTVGQRQTLVFDNSAKTLNFMSSPVTGSWPPRSIALTTTTTNAPVDGNTSSNSQQQHLFQFQLQKPHTMQQQQPANAAKFPKNSTVMSFPQQQGRASQCQTQISFVGNPKSSLAPQGQQRLTNDTQSSSSLVACSSMTTLPSQPTENSSPGGNGKMSSPACGRNLPPILNTCPSHISELKY